MAAAGYVLLNWNTFLNLNNYNNTHHGKERKQKEVSINPDLLAQAENISKGIMERITKAHADSSKSKSARETLQKRKAENHLQREFDINVKDSFMLSLSNCLNAKGKLILKNWHT